jgi:polyphosphate kinase
VLEEGLRPEKPLLERLKFMSIASSNFDEFFMVRVASTKRQLRTGNTVRCPSGISPRELLRRITEETQEIVYEQYHCLTEQIFPGLERNNLFLLPPARFKTLQLKFTQDFYQEEVFPVLTPVRVRDHDRFPFIANMRLHIAFALESVADEGASSMETAIVQVPPVIDRVVWLPDVDGSASFALLEDVILANAASLFPGYTIKETLLFRVTRDADLSVDEERDEDFLEAMEEVIERRQRSFPVRLETQGDSEWLVDVLADRLGLSNSDIYSVPGPMDMAGLMDLAFVAGFDHLRDEEWKPRTPPPFQEDASVWEVLRRQDVLLHHPYEAFDVVVRIVEQAAIDPAVLAIKMTLYRTSGNSPIVRALSRAAEAGKQVTALVELKARFDEERNIGWAQQLERSGVIVVYGIAELKVHAKALLVIRREEEGVVRYVHLGTGNYNDKTARLYTDMGMLTTRDDITFETALFFNAITGYSTIPNLRRLIMAPIALKERLLELIERETQKHSTAQPGLIRAKLNSLADPDVVAALYRASQSGVRVHLNVRGICMLIPGVPSLSDTIHVVSIVDRFLEHTRIIHFRNGGMDELYLSSADWMGRNLERRVELMFPVDQEDLRGRLIETLDIYFRDNSNAQVLDQNGVYHRRSPESGEPRVRAQEVFYERAVERSENVRVSPRREFTVRRRPPGRSEQ